MKICNKCGGIVPTDQDTEGEKAMLQRHPEYRCDCFLGHQLGEIQF